MENATLSSAGTFWREIRAEKRQKARLLSQFRWNTDTVQQLLTPSRLCLREQLEGKDWPWSCETPREFLCCPVGFTLLLTPHSWHPEEPDVEKDPAILQWTQSTQGSSEWNIGFAVVPLKHPIKIHGSYHLPPSKSHHSSAPGPAETCWGCRSARDVNPDQPEVNLVSTKCPCAQQCLWDQLCFPPGEEPSAQRFTSSIRCLVCSSPPQSSKSCWDRAARGKRWDWAFPGSPQCKLKKKGPKVVFILQWYFTYEAPIEFLIRIKWKFRCLDTKFQEDLSTSLGLLTSFDKTCCLSTKVFVFKKSELVNSVPRY